MAMNADHNENSRSGLTTGNNCHVEEELPGYALGCLGRDVSARVSAHLTTCESCRTLLRSYEQTAEYLAFGVPQVAPSDALKDRLMRRVGKQPSVRPTPLPEKNRSFASFFEWFSPALATVCLVVIVSLCTVNYFQWRQSRMISDRMAEPLVIFKMRGTPLAPHADGTFVIGQNPLHGVLVASDMPFIASTQQFQLWLIRNGVKDSGGTFSTTPLGYGVMQISASRSLLEYQSATVTLEPAGGSLAPTGPEMMTGSF